MTTSPVAPNPLNLPVAPNFSIADVAAACAKWGLHLWVPKTIDGARMLWALSGCESSFGKDCQPRHEPIYCTGKYSGVPQVRALTAQYGHAAHCSFGPWQLLLINASNGTSYLDMFGIDRAAMETVSFINTRILKHEGAQTVAEIADAYNSGDWRDQIVPVKYIADCEHYYASVPLPA